MTTRKPWLKYYDKTPEFVEIPNKTTYQLVKEKAAQFPHRPALYYLGTVITYKQLLKQIDLCAASFTRWGIEPSDAVTICAPNIPQTVIAFYALSKIGAIASMLFPLAGEQEILDSLTISNSKMALILDSQAHKFLSQIDKTACEMIVLFKVQDFLPRSKKNVLNFKDFFEGKREIKDPRVVLWPHFIKRRSDVAPAYPKSHKDPSIILYSGGTTGKPKGILYNDAILNGAVAMAMAMAMLTPEDALTEKDAFLAVLPTFHCFGLAIGVHAPLTTGGVSLLVPKPTTKLIYRAMKWQCPKIISGVPTLFNAMLNSPLISKLNLSKLKGVFSGGDKISETLKNRFDELLQKRGCTKTIREGYGLTECAPPCTINPDSLQKIGSIGIPVPNVLAKVVHPDTLQELPYGTDGELCLSGPTQMIKYVDEPEETANVLRKHADGLVWVHTGDICSMDESGFIYFKLRKKRMVKVSGICVYPTVVEEILSRNKAVAETCVIGVPHPYKVNVLKAFVIPAPGHKPTLELKKRLIGECRKNLSPQSCPATIEFLKDFPRTKVGKTDFIALERMERENIKR